MPPFKFVQWDGKLVREIPRLRVKPGATLDPARFKTGYADMAIESWRMFDRLQKAGVIPAGVKFQISCRPRSRRPTTTWCRPTGQKLMAALTPHFLGEVAQIAKALPNDRIALQWDVCQEVLAWEGYYDPGPVDFRKETIDVLTPIGDGVPAAIELGYHLCYGSPADEHVVQPKDVGHHGRDDQCGRRRRQAADPVLPHAGAQGAHRRCLFRAAEEFEASPGDRTLSRPHPPQRHGRRCGAARRRAAACIASTASPPNAAWRAAIPRGCRRCLPPMPRRSRARWRGDEASLRKVSN